MIGRPLSTSLGALALLLTACSSSVPDGTASSTPAEPPSPPATSFPPEQTLIDAPDPCDLVEIEKLPQLNQLVGKKPKKETSTPLKTCMWENAKSHRPASILRVAVRDLRPHTLVPIPRKYDLDCTEGEDTITSTAGKFCLDHDRQGLTITYHNIYTSIIWATTAISRTRPEAKRIRQADRLSRQLAEQALEKLAE